jgi:SecD/SecF fusion protein
VPVGGPGPVAGRRGGIRDGRERVRAGLAGPGGDVAQQTRAELVGPTLGAELRTKALLAVGIVLAAQAARPAGQRSPGLSRLTG